MTWEKLSSPFSAHHVFTKCAAFCWLKFDAFIDWTECKVQWCFGRRLRDMYVRKRLNVKYELLSFCGHLNALFKTFIWPEFVCALTGRFHALFLQKGHGLIAPYSSVVSSSALLLWPRSTRNLKSSVLRGLQVVNIRTKQSSHTEKKKAKKNFKLSPLILKQALQQSWQ